MTSDEKKTTCEPYLQKFNADNGISLEDMLEVLANSKKKLAIICAMTFAASCAILLNIPNIYTARALVIRQSNGDQGGMSAQLMGLMGAVGMGIGQTASLEDQYVTLIYSRAISDKVLEKFDLIKLWETEYRADAYKKYGERISASVGKKDSIISVSIEDENPQRAAEIANFIVEEVQKLQIRLTTSSAGETSRFLENRIRETEEKIKTSSENLVGFQKRNKAFKVNEQANAAIESIAQLQASLAAKEVELGVLKTNYGERSPQIMAVSKEIDLLKEKISSMTSRSSRGANPAEVWITASEVPDLAMEYAKLLRDLKIQEEVFQLLVQQNEMAKISKAREIASFQTLDPAVAPDKKTRPGRSVIAIASTFLAGFVAFLYFMAADRFSRRPQEDRERWESLMERLKPRLRKKENKRI